MKTAIFYYSEHHGNTKKLLNAIANADGNVTLIDTTKAADADYTGYDLIGLASGVYGGRPGKALTAYAERNLPEGKPVFLILTSSMQRDGFFKSMRKTAGEKKCPVKGEYQCEGYDTFGPFKLVGGVSKGHPDEKEIEGAVQFYQGLIV